VAPPLGIIKRAAFTETSIAVEPGDAFLLYTDGLFRWTKDERHRVIPEPLEKVLDHSASSAEALLKRIVAQTAPKNSATTAPDDVAAIAVRREHRQ
jgi:serine phosphatase RsbU (regulator of sigma subunit)